MWRKISLLVVVILAGGVAATALGDPSSDPNLALWYKLDESAGDVAYDSSVYGRDGSILTWVAEGVPPPPNWDPAGGHSGGCLVFSDETRIGVPKDTLGKVSVGRGITISLWLKDAWRVGQN